jgi:coenzyme F420-reducing hydrogenase beta subunit
VDLSVLLLQLADEYINAAHSLGPLAAKAQRADVVDQYHKLMATGLGCMQAALKNYNQSPRAEAMLRLRYAGLLIEETENRHEIEEVLSKGVSMNRIRINSP